MAEGVFVREGGDNALTLTSTASGGDVLQLPTGEPCYLNSRDPVASATRTAALRSQDKVTTEKTTGVVLLPGCDAIWDYSANKILPYPGGDRDFRAGLVTEDASSAALSCLVDLHKPRNDKIDLQRDGFNSTSQTGTFAYSVSGYGPVQRFGGSHRLLLSATNEVQKLDLWSRESFSIDAKWIAEFDVFVESVGSGSAPDFSFGVASGTHATDFDSVTQRVNFRVNGNSLVINSMSTDGTTTVAEATTGVSFTAGTTLAVRKRFWIDGRDKTSVKLYIDGVRVNSGSTFVLTAAAGPLFLFAGHLEKTAAADTFIAWVDNARLWTSEQA